VWASLAVGQSDVVIDMGDETLTTIASALAGHPLLKGDLVKVVNIASETILPTQDMVSTPNVGFCPTGEGWFEVHVGKSARDVVRGLKKARRVMKDSKFDIDDVINQVRHLKRMEVDATLKSLDWATSHHDTIRELGLDEKALKSLRLFGNPRQTGLLRACNSWESADETLKQLDDFADVWGDEERMAWVNAMELKKDARKVWKTTLHRFDTLNEDQQQWLQIIKGELEKRGNLGVRSILENVVDDSGYLLKEYEWRDEDGCVRTSMIHTKGNRRFNPTVARVAKLLKMYGEEICIIKAHRKGEYMLINREGLVIKDAWAYAAGFLDADGYITITERGEPRAGFIATGDRGRMHCEELHKNVGAGVLQLDQKVYKNGQRSQHRVSFYSKDDLTKLLDGITPHLRMKDRQAKAVVAFLTETDPVRKTQLQRFVQFSNRDGTAKGEESLRKWGVDKDTVMSWAEGI
jgi:hypothetical protein